MTRRSHINGFTLIELSIVLVIIGLIIGGVLAGRDLIQAAAVRAQIAQIESFNTAANTFLGKYGYLPGDIPAGPAAQFGLAARGQYAGEGDGNGIIEGIFHDSALSNCGIQLGGGESVMFWSDLSAVHLISGSFTAASATVNPPAIAQNALGNYLPAAKLGSNNYIYVWSGGNIGSTANPNAACLTSNDGFNYFGIEAITGIGLQGVLENHSPGLTVKQASDIDAKIDDGLPQSGRVKALYFDFSIGWQAPLWAAGGGNVGANTYMTGNWYGPTTAATSASSTTCYDNGGSAGVTQQYSVKTSNGANVNCGLSFKFQ